MEVLGLEQVGLDDNLFALGGHSLLATQIISRVHETFGMKIPLYRLFEAPTITGLAKQIELALRPESVAQPPAIVPLSGQGERLSTFSQEWMWFIHQLQPESAAYNIPLAVRSRGPLDLAALERSINEIIRRHESLRTTFRTVNGRPVPVIAPTLTLSITTVDLRGVSKSERETELLTLVRDRARQPFDLSRGPLLRVHLYRLAETDHVISLTAHHAIFDAWSAGIVARELITLYEAFAASAPNPLPDPSLQYADFAYWQREWIQNQVSQAQLAYWRQRLIDVPGLALRTDRPRAASQTFHGALAAIEPDTDLFAALRKLSQGENVTLFMTLLAAFKTLLYRYTGQVDIAVGMPIANRHWLASEDLIGPLVNILVLRTDLSGNPSFRELLSRVREVVLEAYTHQDLPLETLVAELASERDLRRSPLIQVMFNYVNIPLPPMTFADLTWQPLLVDRRAAQFDLTLTMIDTEPLQRLGLEYNTHLFETRTISQMLAQYQTLLTSIVANPDERLAYLSLLTEADRNQLLVDWSKAQVDYPQDQCLHHLFEVQAERTPEAVAVTFEAETLTYQALNERANQLARYLRSLGVGPGVCVGVYMRRSLEMVIGLLGVLKAGGAYLPLDPAYPEIRIKYMVAQARASIVLTQHELAPRLASELLEPEPRLICLDTDWGMVTAIAGYDTEKVSSQVTPTDLAYVIYTSGSTGHPKGVEVPHRAVVNLLCSMSQKPGLTSADALLAITTLAFDISVLELFLPLIVGAKVVLVSQEVAQDGYALAQCLTRVGVTVMQASPATWQMLLDAGWPGDRRLKGLCGGEVLPPDLAEALLARLGSLWNLYGPTEATVWSTVYQVETVGQSIPIGRPIANTQVYILDDHLQPLPAGVIGELYIGGDGLAHGYLNQPDLTDQVFVSNPFDTPGERLYRTGDLACYLADGNLEFHGRSDQQVKIRGFRIEPGEIEAALRQHPGVRQAVVTVSEAKAGDKRLVAYILPEPNQGPPVGELRRFLGAKLPAYMVPAAFMSLPHLPLTPNGKLDRLALPAPISPRWGAGGDEAFIAPRGPLEERLAGLWCELLGLERVGVHDNFFELGGHSLLAVDLFNKIEQLFGEKLPLATLFEAPTIAQLAGILGQADQTATWSSLVAIQPTGTKPPFFFVHAHGGNVIGYYDLARRLGPDQPFYGLQAQGLDGRSLRPRRFEAMAAHYIKEIRTLQPRGPYYLGGWCLGGNLAYEMAQQLRAQGEEVALLVLVESTPPNYPRYLPRTGQFRRLLYRLIERIDLEIRNLLEREGGARWSHLVGRVKRVMAIIQVKGEKLLALTLPHLHRQIGSSPAYTFAALEEAHLAAYRNYKTQPYQGYVTLFRAGKQPLGIYPDPKLGWGELIEGDLDVYELPGHQIGLLSEPRVRVVAEYLRACLKKAQSG